MPNATVLKATVVTSLGGLLFGFDTAVISGATHDLTLRFNLSPAMLGITVASALWGTAAGALLAGIPADRLGRRDSMRFLAVFYLISALGCAFAWNWHALVFFRVLGGLAIGGSSVLGPMYIAEIAPAAWRGRLVGFFQFNVVAGILVAFVSNFGIGLLNFGHLEWRWKFGVSALPSALFFLMLFAIPRSPRWLAQKDRIPEAQEVLRIFGYEKPYVELETILESLQQNKASDKLFARQHSLPIFLAVSIGAFNQLSGINAVWYYLNDIFARAGFSRVSGDLQAVLVGITNLVAGTVALCLIDRLGRKTLLLIGSVGCAAALLGVFWVFHSERHANLLLWCLISFIGFFSFSQGAVIWVYISEVFPTSVRARGQSLGSFSHWFTNALVAALFPVISSSSGAIPFAFFAGMMFLQFIVVLFIYPETKGISLEMMQKRLRIT
jgi:sugar porter (SP) family MFS transporter